MLSRLRLYFDTLRHLKATQIVHQVTNRFAKTGRPAQPYPEQTGMDFPDLSLFIPELDAAPEYIARFMERSGFPHSINLLHTNLKLDYSEDYLKTIAPLLRNNILYFEYAIPLAVLYRQTGDSKYLDIFTSLYEAFLKADNSPNSYIYSLHIPNLLIAMEVFGNKLPVKLRDRIVKELHTQYRFLERNLEKHLLANHYFENIKTLVIASFYFGEIEKCERYLTLLKKETKEEINSDGLHYERSAMYHKIILEGLLRTLNLSRNFENFPKCNWLEEPITAMAGAINTFEDGFDRTPLFNDAGDNVAKPLPALNKALNRIIGYSPVPGRKLPESGYFKLKEGNVTVNIDCGHIGPDYQPGHAHNDSLSFEVAVKGTPLFVNGGTLLYQGKERAYFRSTRAHNAVMAGDCEQSQCWGEHRVGRRLKVLDAELKGNDFKGSYRDFKGNIIQRTFSLKNNVLSIEDSVKSRSATVSRSFLHIADGFEVINEDNEIKISGVCNIKPLNCSFIIHRSGEITFYAPDFGKLKTGVTIEFYWENDEARHGFATFFHAL